MNQQPSNEQKKQSLHIHDIINCYICYNKSSQPVICPTCSALYCKSCITKWIIEEKEECPNCRAPLDEGQLVKVRFVDDIKDALESLHISSSDICNKHQISLTYYCTTCMTAICSDCAMIDTDHKDHKFEKLNQVYEQHIKKIMEEEKSLTTRIQVLNENLYEIELKIESVSKAKDERENEINVIAEQIQSNLDAQLKSKLLSLMTNKTSITEEIELLQVQENEIKSKIENSSKGEIIVSSNQILQSLEETLNKPQPDLDISSVTPYFKSELVPEYDSGTFEILEFAKVKSSQEIVYSPSLTANGITWRLKVYPNGNGMAKGTYISVFLELQQGIEESSKYEYRVEMLNQKNKKDRVAREYVSDFEPGECWGYNRFYKIELLEKEGFILPDENKLILHYYVRPPTYAQKCRDQEHYIKILESTLHKKSIVIENKEGGEHANDGDSPHTPVNEDPTKCDSREEDIESI